MSSIQTDLGTVSLDELVRVYVLHKKASQRHQEARLKFLQTEKGKEFNRSRAKAYYEKHKDTVLEKRKAYYQKKKEKEQEEED